MDELEKVINVSIDSQMPRVGLILWRLTHVTECIYEGSIKTSI